MNQRQKNKELNNLKEEIKAILKNPKIEPSMKNNKIYELVK